MYAVSVFGLSVGILVVLAMFPSAAEIRIMSRGTGMDGNNVFGGDQSQGYCELHEHRPLAALQTFDREINGPRVYVGRVYAL